MKMKFSLILCTVGRYKEVEDFFASLSMQQFKNYELIVVDQNSHDRIKELVERYSEKLTQIKYFKVDFKGLSRARNFGLQHAEGDILAFPDDDCKYPEDLLMKVNEKFESEDIDILTGRSIDDTTGSESNVRWKKKKTKLTKMVLLETCISYTIFVKACCVISNKVRFDERLGVGSGTPFQSAEETDFIYQLIQLGCRGIYDPEVYVYHPEKIVEYSEQTIQRAFYYSMGMGALFKKHIEDKRFLIVLTRLLLRAFGGILYNLLKGNLKGAKFYCKVLAGRWGGFRQFKDEKVQR
uniref:Glycosyltransferase family 2 protein n=1 Tax=Fervidobacterium pennivorans TaxID=93466 RepID=A0A7V4NFJ4_FERPE